VLLLRGPQTPGELRGRTERMHRFDEIGDVLAGLQKLMEREPSLVAVLPRLPGTKEARYAHLMSGPVEMAVAQAAPAATFAHYTPPATVPYAAGTESGAGADDRVARLEAVVAQLQSEFAEMKRKFDDLFGDG
jgi:uncharacterized protein YceH (UPF0502 family)